MKSCLVSGMFCGKMLLVLFTPEQARCCEDQELLIHIVNPGRVLLSCIMVGVLTQVTTTKLDVDLLILILSLGRSIQ